VCSVTSCVKVDALTYSDYRGFTVAAAPLLARLGTASAALLLVATASPWTSAVASPTVQGEAGIGSVVLEPGPAPIGLSETSPADDVIPVVAEKVFDLGSDQGFAGQVTDYDKRAITVFWTGVVPNDIQKYVDSKPYGVDISIESGMVSRADAEAARSRLKESPLSSTLGVVSISVAYDGSGLHLGVKGTRTSSAEILDEVKAVAGIGDAVAISVGASDSRGYANRNNDASPWKGGIRMKHKNSGFTSMCTSGFAVIKNGTGRLLGARHCDTTGNSVVRDGGGDKISDGGAQVQRDGVIDSLLIDPIASPATTPKIYRGSYNSSTKSTVKNWYSNWPGDPVCSSGASTGEHCGTVYDDNQDIYFNGFWVNVIQVNAPSGSIMGGEGDSGASMFKKVSGGVQARGVLLGPDSDHNETTNCGTVNPDVGSIECSRWINYVPISTILNRWGATLEVG